MAVGDWVPCIRYGTQQSADLNPALTEFTLNVLLVGVGAANIGTQGEVGTVEVESEVLTKRVVGPMMFRAAFVEGHTLIVHERIRVALRNDTGDLSFYAEDLNEANDANEPFLWERVATLEVTPGVVYTWPQADVGHPGWSTIDVRVARRLRRQDALIYSVQVNQFEGGGFDVTDLFTIVPWLRTWARALEG